MLFYYLYFSITWCANFLMPDILARRLNRNKEHPSRLKEKLGRYSLPRPKGKVIWFHVASVGELNSIVPLVKLLEESQKILITTVTLNASKLFAKAGFKHAMHQFAPLDTPQIVEKFLGYWKPNVGIFIDSELWPNLLAAASKRFKVINLNARLSDRSAKKWGYIKSAASYIYDKFSIILPCSNDDMRKISKFVPTNKLQFIGNLKLAAGTMEANEVEYSKFKKLLRGKLVVVAASTHEGEEEIIATAFTSIKASHPNVFLIIAPRNPARGKEVSHICKRLGLTTSLRSQTSEFHKNDCVYIADSIGEMGLWYRVAEIVIVGGSLIPHGGHNVVEPAKLNNAIITGTYTHNFRDIISHFVHNKALVTATKDELEGAMKNLVVDAGLRKTLADKALQVSDASEVLEKAKTIILTLI